MDVLSKVHVFNSLMAWWFGLTLFALNHTQIGAQLVLIVQSAILIPPSTLSPWCFSSPWTLRWIAPSCWPWWFPTRPTWPAASSPRSSPQRGSPSRSRMWTSLQSSLSTPSWSALRRGCRPGPLWPCSLLRTPTTSSTSSSGTKTTLRTLWFQLGCLWAGYGKNYRYSWNLVKRYSMG